MLPANCNQILGHLRSLPTLADPRRQVAAGGADALITDIAVLCDVRAMRKQCTMSLRACGRWQPAAPMHEARSYAAAGSAEGRVVVVGGWDGVSPTRLSSAEALPVQALESGEDAREAAAWGRLPPMSCPRYGACVASVE